jgi:DivIVA domain-containing protein
MAESPSSDSSTQRFERPRSASERLRDIDFPLAVRGYDRAAVDDFVSQVRSLVAELESNQTREGVVQKALDQVGTETAGILQRAHETADEIAARSRAQADGRLQRAEREAELIRREAEEYSERVVVDTRLLWDQRQGLIEDLRQLADTVLATADDAMERVKIPDPLAALDPEPTTAENEVARPIGLAPADANGLAELDEDDAAAVWEAGAVDDPAYEEGGPDDAGAVDDPTEAYELGALEPDAREELSRNGALDSAEAQPPVDDEPGHTVELEALPGGAGDEPVEPEDERERD